MATTCIPKKEGPGLQSKDQPLQNALRFVMMPLRIVDLIQRTYFKKTDAFCRDLFYGWQAAKGANCSKQPWVLLNCAYSQRAQVQAGIRASMEKSYNTYYTLDILAYLLVLSQCCDIYHVFFSSRFHEFLSIEVVRYDYSISSFAKYSDIIINHGV